MLDLDRMCVALGVPHAEDFRAFLVLAGRLREIVRFHKIQDVKLGALKVSGIDEDSSEKGLHGVWEYLHKTILLIVKILFINDLSLLLLLLFFFLIERFHIQGLETLQEHEMLIISQLVLVFSISIIDKERY